MTQKDWQKTQEPISTPKTGIGSEGETVTHPAFGQISVSRISGGAMLYGSEFRHQHYVSVRIKESEFDRSLSRDWPHARRELIEIYLSEAQWGAFVSSFNIGDGTQCTIRHVGGAYRPMLPDPRDCKTDYERESKAKVADVVDRLHSLRAKVDAAASGLTKTKRADLLDEIDRALMEVGQNLPFVAKSFAEHMETTVEKAKTEINAYMTNAVVRAGLSALSQDAPLLLGDDAA